MRIGIVGAGISGLSAAHYLMKKGYRDICVIDESERVGGKCHTIVYQGKTYEIGAIMGLASHKRIQNLMKKYQIKTTGTPLTRGHYTAYGKPAAQLPAAQRSDFVHQLARLPEILQGYPWLDTIGFTGCPDSLKQPFSSWCRDNELAVLMKIYEQCFTTFGFGDVERVPAGYVLKIITYENLMGFLEISRILTWSKGTSALLQRMADQVPELRLTQRVLNIEPQKEGSTAPIKVTLSSGVQYFDRLIYTGDMAHLCDLMPLSAPISDGLRQVYSEDFRVYAFRLKGIPELCGYVPENLKKERLGHLTVWYHRWPSEQGFEVVTVYAYGTPNTDEAEQIHRIICDLEDLGCTDIQLHHHKAWKHFPHLESDALKAGFYDTLEASQGLGGIYYAGELLAGPNLENCAAYSEQLIQLYF